MKNCAFVALAAALLTSGCVRSKPLADSGTTTVAVSGPVGGVVTGFYVQQGRTVVISNAVPWNMAVTGLSSLELRKATPVDTITVDLRYDSPAAHAYMSRNVGPGLAGIRVIVKRGFSASTF